MKDPKELVQEIIEKFREKKIARGQRASFGYIRETSNAVIVSRENGDDTRVPFKKIELAIEFYRDHLEDYDEGPVKLRKCGLTHITSPIWALIHLISKSKLLEN